MDKIIIEVGSTVTKVSRYDGNKIFDLENNTIKFKNNYKINNCLDKNDISKLVDIVKNYIKDYKVEVYGTSIFRDLSETDKNKFLNEFKEYTGIKFDIISQEQENEITVKGIIKGIDQKVAVFIGGGGSTEISICENGKIIEMVNTKLGIVDFAERFPDLSLDYAKTDLQEIREAMKGKFNLPKNKVDILILGGGAHKYFAYNSGITYEKNKLYQNDLQEIMMNIDTRKKDTVRYYKEISLDSIRRRVSDPNWWDFTRHMCAIVLEVAEELDAKYIVPTDMGLVYGLLD